MCGGIGICVSKAAVRADDTEAHYWVQNTAEVYELIAALTSVSSGDPEQTFISKIDAAEPAEWKNVMPAGSAEDLAALSLGEARKGP